MGFIDNQRFYAQARKFEQLAWKNLGKPFYGLYPQYDFDYGKIPLLDVYVFDGKRQAITGGLYARDHHDTAQGLYLRHLGHGGLFLDREDPELKREARAIRNIDGVISLMTLAELTEARAKTGARSYEELRRAFPPGFVQ